MEVVFLEISNSNRHHKIHLSKSISLELAHLPILHQTHSSVVQVLLVPQLADYLTPHRHPKLLCLATVIRGQQAVFLAEVQILLVVPKPPNRVQAFFLSLLIKNQLMQQKNHLLLLDCLTRVIKLLQQVCRPSVNLRLFNPQRMLLSKVHLPINKMLHPTRRIVCFKEALQQWEVKEEHRQPILFKPKINQHPVQILTQKVQVNLSPPNLIPNPQIFSETKLK